MHGKDLATKIFNSEISPKAVVEWCVSAVEFDTDEIAEEIRRTASLRQNREGVTDVTCWTRNAKTISITQDIVDFLKDIDGSLRIQDIYGLLKKIVDLYGELPVHLVGVMKHQGPRPPMELTKRLQTYLSKSRPENKEALDVMCGIFHDGWISKSEAIRNIITEVLTWVDRGETLTVEYPPADSKHVCVIRGQTSSVLVSYTLFDEFQT